MRRIHGELLRDTLCEVVLGPTLILSAQGMWDGDVTTKTPAPLLR